MQLMNYMRDAFISAVMQDVPSVNHTEEIRKLVNQDLINQLPPDVKKVWNNPDLRAYVCSTYSSFGTSKISVAHPTNEPDRWNRPNPKLTDKAQEQLTKLDTEQVSQTKLRRELEAKIKAVAYACNTRKQLADALPEFQKYLPEDREKAMRALPVVANVVTDFVKAGWPKTQTKAKGKAHAA
ncbi:hypothetical protein UFOVP148_31 [uncultured Caudovirales phage]|uniref:Nucleotide modification associated domain-containing protein n=1 Tax=uncultured Caudovirales phage TaxID=2100421 RepID=A0A6J7W6D3_9CAUD|nr:hypothetical protein UFOVP148_31 [uncultured Caudovirales phage]